MGLQELEKQRMRSYVLRNLVSSNYEIRSATPDEIQILGKDTEGMLVHLFLTTDSQKVEDYQNAINSAIRDGHGVSNLFYKDGVNFGVRLAGKARLKSDKSLKRHQADLNDIWHLREKEKFALFLQGETQTLTYYQPKTERLPEGIRTYQMDSVIKDYDHELSGEYASRFAETGIAKDWRIAKEVVPKNTRVSFSQARSRQPVFIMSPLRNTQEFQPTLFPLPQDPHG